ncbi:exosortase H-associated membrane protein [Rhodoferax sp.]|uniref:exosortase H-associated membrane protein n=1 Tax=Rhodoferax sp. TaxID=50421 RepID=UPI00260CCC43|nr:exosortase H-associated membrane protein [Rhodoferax sp.]MDD2919865.1 hypothetical protein [Rhodoferax sp.]
MRQPSSVIAIFFVRALAFLVPALALWYWARDYVVMPVAWLAGWLMRYFFPGWVSGSELDGINLTLLTRLTVPHVSGQIAELTPEVSVLTYCYGLPLLVALLLAARAKGLWWKLPTCAVGLLPFQAWGVCFAWLLQVAVQSGPQTRAVTYFNAWDVNLIGLGNQIGFLLLPTLVPMLMWLYLERSFVITVAVEGAMEGTVSRH